MTHTTADRVQHVGRGDLPGAGSYHVRVSGSIDGISWQSTDGIRRTVSAGGLGWEINC